MSSVFTEQLWHLRFLRRRRVTMRWHRTCQAEQWRWNYAPHLEKYADFVEGVCTWRRERWILMSRMWFGWPDPPEFAFFALDQNEAVICAADFNRWPKRWTKPDYNETGRCTALQSTKEE